LKERDEKDRSWIVLVVVLVLVIAFLWACFEDEDENEDEISRKVLVHTKDHTKDISHRSNHLCECMEQRCRAEVRSVWFGFLEGAGGI
jgi:hypothetical protein